MSRKQRKKDDQELNEALDAITTYRRRTELSYGKLKEEAIRRMNMLNSFVPFIAPPAAQDIIDSNEIMADHINFLSESLNLVFNTWSEKVGPLLVKNGKFMINLIEGLRTQLGEEVADKIINEIVRGIDSANAE